MVYFLLFLGLFIRLILANLPGMRIDTDAWFAWALRLQGGPANFYSDIVWTNYTPGYLYILHLLGFLKETFNMDTDSFNYLLKIPSIVSEVLLAWLVYQLTARMQSKRTAILAMCFILFNPFVIFNSAIWGQIEGVLTLMILLSINYLNLGQPILSSVFSSLAFLVKPQTISITPVFLFYVLRSSLKNFLKLTTVATLTIFILSLPFFPNNPFGIVNLFFKMVSDYSYTSLYALNIWPLLTGMFVSDYQKFWILNYNQWGQLLLLLYWIFIFLFFRKGKISLYALATLSLLSFSFLPTRVHERYLYPGLVFLIIYSFYIKDKFLIFLSTILSLIHFLSLYYAYVYYDEFYLKLPHLLYTPILYNLIERNFFALSLISVLIFIGTTYQIVKKEYVKAN